MKAILFATLALAALFATWQPMVISQQRLDEWKQEPGPARQLSAGNVHGALNDVRAYFGRQPLRTATEAQELAATRAWEACQPGGFNHDKLRARHERGEARQFAEILAHNYDTDRETVQAWLDSESHRLEVLRPQHRRAAVGLYGDCVAVLLTMKEE